MEETVTNIPLGAEELTQRLGTLAAFAQNLFVVCVRPKENVGSHRTEVTDGCEQPYHHEGQESNLGPLEEQPPLSELELNMYTCLVHIAKLQTTVEYKGN